ncbi:uncharacterized protein LOC121383102 [Gigantopelta aegis]|uniref:uncharacterized protein LOC121383102 n=1 Tax=Gigantopelta aegis TaxID=1735272 RepID=UPI001B887742|nr:uncharacterized protein LOC121383102 [Gigantopelta aegis]
MSWCCTGHGGCICSSCSSQYNMTFEAVKTPVHSFDDVVKNWALESKEELRRTVKSFFATKLAPSNDHCCKCTSCSQKCRKCSPVALPCCCKGLVCACVFCPSGKIVMEADSVDFLGDKRANLNERMSLVDSLIDRILINLN